MNNRFCFNHSHTFVLTGIMMLAALTCGASSNKQKDAHQVQTLSNWNRMQSAAPKLFGAGLVVGGAYGAYVYSGAFKRYVSEQPVDALKNATFLGGSLLTNFWWCRRVNELNQQRVRMSPEKRSKSTDYDRVSNLAFMSWSLPALVYKIYGTYNNYFSCTDNYVLGFCGLFSLVNSIHSRDCKRDNDKYDDLDRKITNPNGLGRSVQSYNLNKTEATKKSVQEDLNTYKEAYAAFLKSIQERGAQNQDWVTHANTRYELILEAFNNWDSSSSSGLLPAFDESVFVENVGGS